MASLKTRSSDQHMSNCLSSLQLCKRECGFMRVYAYLLKGEAMHYCCIGRSYFLPFSFQCRGVLDSPHLAHAPCHPLISYPSPYQLWSHSRLPVCISPSTNKPSLWTSKPHHSHFYQKSWYLLPIFSDQNLLRSWSKVTCLSKVWWVSDACTMASKVFTFNS